MFLEHSSSAKPHVFTFGYGPYDCIGRNFAQLEIKVAVVKFLQHFQFTVKPEHTKYARKIFIGVETDRPVTVTVQNLKEL